ARHFDRAGALTMGDFIRYLDEFVKNELRQEQAPVEQAGGDVVQIMTVHKAKGLEFPIVVVPDTGAGTRGGRQQQMFINPLTGIALKLKDDDEEASGGAKPAAYVLAKRKDDEADRAEHLRTFYVAATRAKEYLVLSANAEIDRKSWLAQLRTALPFEVAHGETEIEYGDGYRLRLFVGRPGREVHRGPKRAGPRDIFADGRVRPDAIKKPKSRPPKDFATVLENIKPPPSAASPAIGAMAGTISVTALTDFEACPVLYRLRYELGMGDAGSDGGIFAPREDVMTAAEEGTVFHSVFEKVVADPEADIGKVLERALGENETSPAPEAASQFADLVRSRVEAFCASALGRRVAAATDRDTEAPFVMKMGEAVLSGVVDLVFGGEGGEVEIVDYKSDRVSAEDAKRRGGEYEIQLGIYAIAMSRHLGRPIGRASVYFIRPAVEVEIPADRAALEAIEQRARGVIEGIASGDRRRVRACPAHCRCRQLCDRLMESGE
ncbi:MAG: PD-(D/E)XK nuclease family protein, partial [Phycisphaerae bacterium]|nr:PD-(D/E)XK nuclease family protein [Phycisphaerae bacterium]